MATLIIVSGPSASGKSTLSHRLSKDLQIPMICRDDIKEALFDSMKKAEGVTDRQRSIEYGSAAALILVREVEEFLKTGVSCIIEAKFNPKFSQAELSGLIEKTGANAIQIQTVCDGQVLYSRFKERSLRGERHPGHGDSGNAEEFKDELLDGRFPALDIQGDLLEYDTTQEDENAYQGLLVGIQARLDSHKSVYKILCHDIHGNAHVVDQDKLIKRQASYAFIVQDQKLLLVCDRSGNDRWDFPGGGVDPGEASLEALEREVKEETGLQVAGTPELICSFIEYFYDLEGQAGWESHRSYYRTDVTGKVNTTGNDDDIIAIRSFALPLGSGLHVSPIVALLAQELD